MQNNNNNIKKVIPEPLLFIHTVSTPIMSNGSQRYYDSRDPEKSKSKEKAELIIGKEENKKSKENWWIIIKKNTKYCTNV